MTSPWKGKNIVFGNWKMALDLNAAQTLATNILAGEAKVDSAKACLGVCPSSLHLSAIRELLSGSKGTLLGSQNAHWEESGAYTGENSWKQLKDFDCAFTLVGHSERRHGLFESHSLVSQRALGCLENGLAVVFCCGETLEERESGKMLEVLQEQFEPLLSSWNSDFSEMFIIAYEPVWAIGTGKVATLEEIQEAHRSLQELWKSKTSEECPPILYGGSVKPDNFAEILALDEVNGALVGGASLKADSFLALAEIASQ